MTLTLRSWATPLVAGSFLIMAASGVLIFFHLDPGMMKSVHEFAGFAMVAGGIAHLALNWRAFTTYFRRPLAKAIMGLGVVVLGLSAFSFGSAAQSPRAVMEAMSARIAGAPLELVAELSGKTEGDVIAALVAQGLEATPQSTIADLAGDDPERRLQAIQAVFATPQG